MREGGAHIVGDDVIAMRRCKNAGQLRLVGTAHVDGLPGDFDRQQHAFGCTPPLIGWQAFRRWPRTHGSRHGAPRELLAQGVEMRPMRRPKPHAIDMNAQRIHGERSAWANARQILLPPKPNELLSATSTRRLSLRNAHCGPQCTSGSSQPTFPGTVSSAIASKAITASTMPAAPKVCPVSALVELARVVDGKFRVISCASTSSFFIDAVPCRLM